MIQKANKQKKIIKNVAVGASFVAGVAVGSGAAAYAGLAHGTAAAAAAAGSGPAATAAAAAFGPAVNILVGILDRVVTKHL